MSKYILKICIAVAKRPAQFSTIIKNFYKLSRKQKTPSLYHHKSILKQNNPVQRIHPDSSDNFHAQSACVLKLCLLGIGCGPYLNKLESCFVPSLVDICPTVLGKKNLKFCQCIYFCFVIYRIQSSTVYIKTHFIGGFNSHILTPMYHV